MGHTGRMTPPGAHVVVGFGELLWDRFPDARRPGGAPANVAWHASQHGARGIVVSRLGRDADGAALRQTLEDRGLDVRHVQEDPSLPTGAVDVDDSDPEAPRYTIHEPVAWDALQWDVPLARLASQADAVCYGTLVQRSETSRHCLGAFLEAARGAYLFYDVNLRQDYYDRAWILSSLAAADAVKLNEAEAGVVGSMVGSEHATPASLYERLRSEFGVDTLCVTRAERGCIVLQGDERIDVPGRPVNVVDAVGAGDAFSAAFLSAHLGGASVDAAARFANAAGALVASRAGAMPHLELEYASLRRRLIETQRD